MSSPTTRGVDVVGAFVVKTDSRLHMWRPAWYSSVMPLAPNRSRALRAHSRAMRTLLRLAKSRPGPGAACRLPEATEVQRQELGLADLFDHVDELGLDQLMTGERAGELADGLWCSAGASS